MKDLIAIAQLVGIHLALALIPEALPGADRFYACLARAAAKLEA